MGGGDHRLSLVIAFADHLFLQHRNLFRGNFHPQVSPGHHDPVGNVQDGIQVVDTFLIFDLGDYMDIRIVGLQDLSDFQHIVGLSDKEAAMKSTPCRIPNRISSASFSVIPGN